MTRPDRARQPKILSETTYTAEHAKHAESQKDLLRAQRAQR